MGVFIHFIRWSDNCGFRFKIGAFELYQGEVLERAEGIKREYNELDTVWFMAGSLFQVILQTTLMINEFVFFPLYALKFKWK